jgi:hypothetical protein
MADKLDRFKNLERAREGGEAPSPSPSKHPTGRFEAMENEPAQLEARGTSESLKRFKPAEERPLELASGGASAQPFMRCMKCEADNTNFAARCFNCGDDLTSEPQKAFNDRFWEKRLAADAEEREGEAERASAREAEETRQRRLIAEAQVTAAKEMAEHERFRVESSLRGTPGDGTGFFSSWTPLGIRLLRGIDSPLIRLGVVVGAVGVPAILVAASSPGHTAFRVGLVGFGILGFLLTPPTLLFWRRRYWW